MSPIARRRFRFGSEVDRAQVCDSLTLKTYKRYTMKVKIYNLRSIAEKRSKEQF